MTLSRRTLLAGLFFSPAIVRVGSLMPIRLWEPDGVSIKIIRAYDLTSNHGELLERLDIIGTLYISSGILSMTEFKDLFASS